MLSQGRDENLLIRTIRLVLVERIKMSLGLDAVDYYVEIVALRITKSMCYFLNMNSI